MFKLLGKFFRIKSKELEAKLQANANCPHTGVGEIEISFYTDNTAKVELSIKHSRIPSGTELVFFAEGRELGKVISQNGFAKQYIKLENLESNLLNLNVGSKAEIRIDGSVQYEGEFRPD